MYMYHALINTMSTHTIHVNLNMISYAHIEHSSTQTTHTKHNMERQTTPPPPQHTHTQKQKTTMNSNVYNADLYHTSYSVISV